MTEDHKPVEVEKLKLYHYKDRKPIVLNQAVATCPECKEQAWHINLNDFRMDFEKILSFECVSCGFEIALEENVERI